MRSPLFSVAVSASPSTSSDRMSSAPARRRTSLKATSRIGGRSARRPKKRMRERTANPPVRTSAARRREEGIGKLELRRRTELRSVQLIGTARASDQSVKAKPRTGPERTDVRFKSFEFDANFEAAALTRRKAGAA